MTNALDGLRASLARVKGGVVALGEMNVGDILANLSDEQRASLAAELAPTDEVEESEAEASEDAGSEEGEGASGSQEQSGSQQASAHDRIKAVAGAADVKGKEAVALALLADDELTGLSAAAIVRLVGQAGAAAASGEDAALAEMRAALATSSNSNIDAEAGRSTSTKDVQAQSVWGSAIARVHNVRPN